MPLTEQQIRFFRQTGYFKLGDRIPTEMVCALKKVIVGDIESRIPPFKTDRAGGIVRLDQLIDRDPIFRDLCTYPPVLGALVSLLGPNVELTRNRHNHATINRRGPSPRLHRDVLQWSRDIVTMVVYLEDAGIENGCTHVLPASQYLPFVGTPNNGGTWMDEHSMYADLLSQAVPIPMSEGGVLLFDGLAFHSNGENTTEHTRISVCMGFRSVDELSANSEDPKLALIHGERIYRGNDL